MTVQWREVTGTAGMYLISDDGQVESRHYGRSKLLKQRDAKHLMTVTFRRNGQMRPHGVHRLMAEAFLPDGYYDGAVVRHLDGNYRHNHLSNLAWGSQRENLIDAVRHGTNANTRKTRCAWNHEYTQENTYWVKNTNGRMRRQCLTCKKAAAKRWWRAKAEIPEPVGGKVA